MAAPIQPNMKHLGQPAAEAASGSAISGGRRYQSNPPSARDIEALGLSQLVLQDPQLASSRPLTEEELAAAPLAKILYRDDMPISHRIQTLNLVQKYGQDFVITVEPLVRDWEAGSEFYSFYEQVAKEPTKWLSIRSIVPLGIEKEAMVGLINAIQSCPDQHLERFSELLLPDDTTALKTDLLNQLSATHLHDPDSFLAFSRLPFCYRTGQAPYRIAALSLLNRVSKESRQPLADLINSQHDYHDLLDSLSQLEASDWTLYIQLARTILPTGKLKKTVRLLVAAENPSALVDLFNFSVTPDQTAEQRFALFESITKLPIKTHQVLRFVRGPGTIEEARLIVKMILDSYQRSYLINLLQNLISDKTPLPAILSLIKLLQARIPWKSAWRHFFREVTCKPKYSVDLESGREMEQLAPLLCNVSSKELVFPDRETLPRAVLQMKGYFASILQDTAMESTDPSHEQMEKAAQLGQMLSLLIENGIKLPPDILLGESFFDHLQRRPLTKIIEDKLSQDGLWKVSKAFGELLIHPSLPPLPHLPKILLLNPTISEKCRAEALSKFKKLSPTVLSLFRDDGDYAGADGDREVKRFITKRDCDWYIIKTAPLFLPGDNAAQKIELINATKHLTREQIANAVGLIREGDSVATRISLARGVEFLGPLTAPLPILPTDTVKMRLNMRGYIKHHQLESVGAVFPPLLANGIPRRCSMVFYFNALKIPELPLPIFENFIRFMMESEENHRLHYLKQLRDLSPEVRMELLALDYERLDEIFSFMRPFGSAIPQQLLNDVAIAAMNSDSLFFSRCVSAFFPFDCWKTKATLFLLLKSISCKEECALFLRNYGYHLGRPEIIHALYQSDPGTMAPLLEQLSSFSPFPAMYKFIHLNPHQREITLQRLRAFLTPEDNPDGRNGLFELLCNMPLERQEAAFLLIKESLSPTFDGNQRAWLFRAVAGCETVEELAKALAENYRRSVEAWFDRYERFEIAIDPLQPKLPQLLPYLAGRLREKPQLIIEGDPAQDEGGPSRAVFTDASREILTHYPFFVKNLDGTFSIVHDAELTVEEIEKALSLGKLFLLMSILGVTMPLEAPLDPTFFHEISYYERALLGSSSIERAILNCRENFEKLQDLHQILYGYQIEKFGIEAFPILEKRERDADELSEDQSTLLQEIRQKGLHFSIAKGLSRNGWLPCLPLIGRLLTFRGNLREILTDRQTWNFDITGDTSLLIDHFMNWLHQCSDEQLANFVFSIRGTAHMPFGQTLTMQTGNVMGPSLHTCFHSIEMPRIPLESEIHDIDKRIEAEKSRLRELPAHLEALVQAQEEALRQLRSENPTNDELNDQLTELAESHAAAREPLERELQGLEWLEKLAALAPLRSYPFFKNLMDDLPRTNWNA